MKMTQPPIPANTLKHVYESGSGPCIRCDIAISPYSQCVQETDEFGIIHWLAEGLDIATPKPHGRAEYPEGQLHGDNSETAYNFALNRTRRQYIHRWLSPIDNNSGIGVTIYNIDFNLTAFNNVLPPHTTPAHKDFSEQFYYIRIDAPPQKDENLPANKSATREGVYAHEPVYCLYNFLSQVATNEVMMAAVIYSEIQVPKCHLRPGGAWIRIDQCKHFHMPWTHRHNYFGEPDNLAFGFVSWHSGQIGSPFE